MSSDKHGPVVQGTTRDQRRQIVHQVEKAVRGETRSQPRRTH